MGIGGFICGICAGLMMPKLTDAMTALVSRTMHGRVISIMNVGTSIGISIAVPSAVFLYDAWRLTCMVFAVLTAAGVKAAWYFIPLDSRLTPGNASPTATNHSVTVVAFYSAFVVRLRDGLCVSAVLAFTS